MVDAPCEGHIVQPVKQHELCKKSITAISMGYNVFLGLIGAENNAIGMTPRVLVGMRSLKNHEIIFF